MEELLAPNFDPAMAKLTREEDVPATVVEITRVDVTGTAESPKLLDLLDLVTDVNKPQHDKTTTVSVPTTVDGESSEDAITTVTIASTVDDLASVVKTTSADIFHAPINPEGASISVASVTDVSTRVVETSPMVDPATVVETNVPKPLKSSRQAKPTVVETATVAVSVEESVCSEKIVSPEKIGLLAQARPPRELAPVWESLLTGKTFPAKSIQFVSIAQHSMSGGQERFYESIWRSKSDYKFRVDTESREVKRFCAGYDVLSQVCRLATRNVRNMIPVLISKSILYSFRDHDSTVRKGTTYQIFSYEEILRRQRAKGLCYVVKNGPSVEFAAPVGWTLDPATTVAVSTTVATSSTAAADVSSRGTVDAVSPRTVDETSRPLDKSIFISQSTTTLNLLLQKQLPTFDQNISDRLWGKCRAQVPDVTEAEVSSLFEAKMPFAFERGIVNPNGFLLTAVAASCTRAAIDAMRRGRELAEPQPEPEVVQSREELIANYESYLEALPNHPAAKLWRSKLDELREGT